MIDQRKLVTRKALMLLSSPAIVRYASLMPIKKIPIDKMDIAVLPDQKPKAISFDFDIYSYFEEVQKEIEARVWRILNIPPHLRSASDYVWATDFFINTETNTQQSKIFAVKLAQTRLNSLSKKEEDKPTKPLWNKGR